MRQLELKTLEDDRPLVQLARAGRPFTLVVRNPPTNPLSDEQVVLATIAVANGALLELPDPSAAAAARSSGPLGYRGRYRLLLMPDDKPAPSHARHGRDRELWIAGLRNLLDSIRDSDALARVRKHIVSAQWKIAAWRTKTIFTHDGVDFHVANYHKFLTEESVVTFGLMLLADSKKGFGARLCRCRLATCGLFFLERGDIGHPQRDYCCVQHLPGQHDPDTKVRRTRPSAKRSVRRVKPKREPLFAP